MAKVAILTNFMEFNPGYSLTGIVQDQVRMLHRYDHEVNLYVNQHFNPHNWPPGLDGLCTIHQKVPFAHLTDYQSKKDISSEHQMTAKATGAMLQEELHGVDYVFTHDWVFTGWNLPYAEGIRLANENLPEVRWFHWVHSIPSANRDWWRIREYGPTHKLVYPNRTDALRCAEQFHGALSDVRVLHHIKDLRTFHEFSPETCALIDQVPGVIGAQIVQLLPASVDRLFAKRVDQVIKIFGWLKKMTGSVCLVVAAQWATGKQQKESLAPYKALAAQAGLKVGQEVVFTCDLDPRWEIGIPKRMVRELFACSNLFIFPTREESFGLVVPEAALAGCLLVLNKSLDMQAEIAGGPQRAIFFDFGSYTRQWNPPADADKYWHDVAAIIIGRMQRDESLMAKIWARTRYNWDTLYTEEYLPAMMEAGGWGMRESNAAAGRRA